MFQDRTQFLEAAEALRCFTSDGFDGSSQCVARRFIPSIDPYDEGFSQVHSSTPARKATLALEGSPMAH